MYHWTLSRQILQRFPLRQANIREKEGPSLGKIQGKIPHQQIPYAMKFEDRYLQERLQDKSDAPAEMRWNLPRQFASSKWKTKSYILSPSEEWILPAASTINPEEREFVVDSGASMHMVSNKDINKAELETARISKNPTIVMTANGEVPAKEKATVYFGELDLFVSVMLLENTPAVPSRGTLCEVFGYSYHWSHKPHLIKKGKKNSLRHIESYTIRRTWFIHEFLYLLNLSYIFIAGNCDRNGNFQQ